MVRERKKERKREWTKECNKKRGDIENHRGLESGKVKTNKREKDRESKK